MTALAKRKFGPFLNVPTEDVRPAGFKCYECRTPVERLAKALPGMVQRMIFHACHCGTVATWEDEAQPKNSRIWKMNIGLLKQTGTELIIFNGDKPLKPDFSGIN